MRMLPLPTFDIEPLTKSLPSLPKFGESKNKNVADLQTPPGWNEFEGKGFHGITKAKIARSSKAYFDRFGNSRDPANFNALSNYLQKPDFSIFTAGQPGLWTVPICYDPNGSQIGGLKVDDKARIFPCMCSGHNNQSVDNPAQVMAEFLEATHLRYSYDYHCQCYSVGRQNCEQVEGGGALSSFYRNPDPPGFQAEDQHKCFKREAHFWDMFRYRHEECLAVYPYQGCKGPGHDW